MSFSTPALLAMGALLSLGVAALHFLAPAPPRRAPLPTARFLDAQPRTHKRLRRRPTDPLFMGLRVAFLLLLFAGLAGPRLTTPRPGVTPIVAILAGDSALVDSARAMAAGGRVIAVDSTARLTDVLRALLDAARSESRTDSVRAWIAIVPTWAAWTPSTAAMRSVWPGPIGLLTRPPERPAEMSALPRGAAAIAGTDSAGSLAAALAAIGYDVIDSDSAAEAGLIFLTETAVAIDGLHAAASAGATVVLPPDHALAGVGPAAGPAVPPLFLGPETLPGAAGTALADGLGHALAAWADGATAIVARPLGAGCIVTNGVRLDAPALRREPATPAVLAALGAACDAGVEPAHGLPLDAAARARLAGDTLAAAPGAVARAALPGTTPGRPLRSLLLAAALLVALLETMLPYARRPRADGTRS